MSNVLEIHREGRLLSIALNRPEKRNALNIQLCGELVGALKAAEQDQEVGAILLTGNGKCFCAGMDLSEINDTNTDEISSVQEQLFTIGARLEKPLVGAVHNAALAGGTGLAANCHIVIAREDAQFGLTEIRLGLWPFLVFRAVTAAIGERRTVELALTGRIFPATEAREFGLVHEVAANSEQRAREAARALAESSPTAIRRGLSFVHEARGKDWKSAGDIARRTRDEVFESKDFNEGLKAFREKRAAQWPSLSTPR